VSYLPLLEGVCLLDPDTIDYEGEKYKNFTAALRIRVPQLEEKYFPYRFLLHLAEEAMNGRRQIIWCQPFSDLEGLEITIQKLGRLAEENGLDPAITIVDVNVDPETAFERINRRKLGGKHGPDRISFEGFVSRFSVLRN